MRIKAVITGGQTYPIPVTTDDPYNVFRLVLALWQRTTGATAFCTGTALHTPLTRSSPRYCQGLHRQDHLLAVPGCFWWWLPEGGPYDRLVDPDQHEDQLHEQCTEFELAAACAVFPVGLVGEPFAADRRLCECVLRPLRK